MYLVKSWPAASMISTASKHSSVFRLFILSPVVLRRLRTVCKVASEIRFMRVSQQFCGPVTITGAGNQVLELTSTDPAASVTRLMAVTSNNRTESDKQLNV